MALNSNVVDADSPPPRVLGRLADVRRPVHCPTHILSTFGYALPCLALVGTAVLNGHLQVETKLPCDCDCD